MQKKIINILKKNNVQISTKKIISELDIVKEIDNIRFSNFTDFNKNISLISKYC